MGIVLVRFVSLARTTWYNELFGGTAVISHANPPAVGSSIFVPGFAGMNHYSSDADDLFVNVNLNTVMDLPEGRDTVLHYFEQMKKAYPELRNLHTRESGDLVLEGDKEAGHYRWLALEPRRLCSGHVNPETLEDAYRQHEMVLELAPHLLTITSLDCEALDVMYGFDLNYEGNHDELVSEALGLGPSLEGLLEVGGARVIHFEPSVTLALDESCRLQCRLSIETRTNTFQVRTGEFPDEQISVYFTIRQHWGTGVDRSFVESFRRQAAIGEQIVQEKIVPRIVHPLARAIASK